MPKDIIIGEEEQAITKTDMYQFLSKQFQVLLQPTEQGIIAQQKIGPVIISTLIIPRETFLQCAREVALQEQARSQLHTAALDALKTKN